MGKMLVRARVLLALIVFFGSTSAAAALLRYDVGYATSLNAAPTNVGYMTFGAELSGSGTQNIWGTLVDWELQWRGSQFTTGNSLPDTNAWLVVDGVTGEVFQDSLGSQSFVCCNQFGRPYLEQSYAFAPRFQGTGGASLRFSGRPGGDSIFDGFIMRDDSDLDIGYVIYSSPSPVPIPATAWLVGSALLGLGFSKRKRV